MPRRSGIWQKSIGEQNHLENNGEYNVRTARQMSLAVRLYEMTRIVDSGFRRAKAEVAANAVQTGAENGIRWCFLGADCKVKRCSF